MHRYWLSLAILFAAISRVCNGDQTENKIAIQAWQYCAGCKGLLELYTGKASQILSDIEKKTVERMKKGHKVDKSSFKVDAVQLAQNICKNNYFNNYIPEMRYTCMMIMQNHEREFLSPFIGADPEEFRQTKGNFFGKSKEICSKTLQACPIEYYQKGDIPPKERSKCAACHIMGDDLEVIMNVAKSTTPTQLLDAICQSVGFSHNPHTWIEEHCEDIVEDHSEKMKEVMHQHLKRIRKNAQDYNPYGHELGDKMCKAILKCPNTTPFNFEVPVDAASEATQEEDYPSRFGEAEL